MEERSVVNKVGRVIDVGTYQATTLQVGEVHLWDEKHGLGDMVINGLEEGAVTAHGAGH